MATDRGNGAVAAPSPVAAVTDPAAHDWATHLRRLGQRPTPQRLTILAALRPGEHVSADDLFARVGPALPAINRSTVYRTLEVLRDLGLVTETDLGDGVRRFELIDGRHHHLICHRCNAVVDLDDDLIAPLRAAIADRYAFTPVIDHLALFGLCAHCAPHPTPNP